MVFFMVRAIPGDPAQILLGQNATQEQVQALTAKMGLDKPILVQYGLFLKDAASGDLGDSIVTGRPVTTELLERLPAQHPPIPVGGGLRDEHDVVATLPLRLDSRTQRV